MPDLKVLFSDLIRFELGAIAYAFTRSPDAAELSMAAMSS